MLRKLFLKDLILNGRMFLSLLWLFVWIAYAANQMHGVAMATVLGAIASTLMTVTLGVREERFHAAAVSYSLPVTRRDVVRHRYLFGYITGIAAFVLGSALVVLVPWSTHTAVEVFDPRTVLFAVVAISLTLTFGLPLVLRLGVMGIFAGLAGLQLAGLLAFAVGALLGSAFAFRSVIHAFEQSAVDLHQALGSAGSAIAILSVVALMTWVSYRLSLFLIERRDV